MYIVRLARAMLDAASERDLVDESRACAGVTVVLLVVGEQVRSPVSSLQGQFQPRAHVLLRLRALLTTTQTPCNPQLVCGGGG